MRASQKAYGSNSFFESLIKILYHQQDFCETNLEILAKLKLQNVGEIDLLKKKKYHCWPNWGILTNLLLWKL